MLRRIVHTYLLGPTFGILRGTVERWRSDRHHNDPPTRHIGFSTLVPKDMDTVQAALILFNDCTHDFFAENKRECSGILVFRGFNNENTVYEVDFETSVLSVWFEGSE